MRTSSILDRKTFCVVDEIGMDPLRDKSFDAIRSITDFGWHTVKESEEHNLTSISAEYYGTGKWWFAILIYNGIGDEFSVKRGTKLRIPSFAALNNALSKANPINEKRTVSF